MVCPNCNSEDIEQLQKSNRGNHKDKVFHNNLYICLKCGLRFTKYIEKIYGSKNL